MISQEKVFFLNQLVDSMMHAADELEKAEKANDAKEIDKIKRYILSIQSEIKNIIMIIK